MRSHTWCFASPNPKIKYIECRTPANWIMAIKRCLILRNALRVFLWRTSSTVWGQSGCFKENEKKSGKICNNATLIAYELKTFSWQPFSLSVNKKTCTEIERNTKEHTVSKKLVIFLVSAIYRYGPVDGGVNLKFDWRRILVRATKMYSTKALSLVIFPNS